MEEASKTDTLFPFEIYDTYNWYLKLGPLSNVNKNISLISCLHGTILPSILIMMISGKNNHLLTGSILRVCIL
jgi:hypothetical protein